MQKGRILFIYNKLKRIDTYISKTAFELDISNRLKRLLKMSWDFFETINQDEDNWHHTWHRPSAKFVPSFHKFFDERHLFFTDIISLRGYRPLG